MSINTSFRFSSTGAIGIGMLVADYLNLPFVYIRPEAKKHGRQNKIEGHLEAGQQVVVIEDLISTGQSSLKAVEALEEADANVKGMLAIFTYGFDVSKANFTKANVKLNTLSDYDHLIEQAKLSSYIYQSQEEALKSWRVNPSNWEAVSGK